MTLYTCLVTLSKLTAPMIPFMAEDIYRNLVCSTDKDAPESVHLCSYPVADESYIDPALEEQMDELLRVVVLGRAARNAAAIKNRQPIGRMYVKADFELDGFFRTIIEEELNVREVVFSDSVRDYTTYTFKPQLKTVGPKYGKQLGEIRPALAGLDGNAAMDELDAKGSLTLALAGGEVVLTREDLLIEMVQQAGYVSQTEGGIAVVLDTNLTEELIEEGFVNELISKLQNMRKDSGFEVTDRIVVGLAGNDQIADILRRHEAEVAGQVLANAITYGEVAEGAREWSLNGEKITLSVTRV